MFRPILLCVFLLSSLATSSALAAERQGCPFFAFDNGVGRDQGMQPEEQAQILADLGYQGIGFTGVNNIPAMLKALDGHGLKMFSTYL